MSLIHMGQWINDVIEMSALLATGIPFRTVNQRQQHCYSLVQTRRYHDWKHDNTTKRTKAILESIKKRIIKICFLLQKSAFLCSPFLMEANYSVKARARRRKNGNRFDRRRKNGKSGLSNCRDFQPVFRKYHR